MQPLDPQIKNNLHSTMLEVYFQMYTHRKETSGASNGVSSLQNSHAICFMLSLACRYLIRDKIKLIHVLIKSPNVKMNTAYGRQDDSMSGH